MAVAYVDYTQVEHIGTDERVEGSGFAAAAAGAAGDIAAVPGDREDVES